MKRQPGNQRIATMLPMTAPIICFAAVLLTTFTLLWFSLHSTTTMFASTVWQAVPMNGIPAADPTATPTVKATSITHYNASKQLVRLAQMNPAEYTSQAEYNTWAGSACSTTAITEVLNAYGRHYRITDVLQIEARVGAITPELGLTSEAGIQATAAQFGFQTSWGHSLTLDQVIATANSGKPVIVSFPPGASSLFSPGHILVITGGSPNQVMLADSSSYNLSSLSRQQFSDYWRGFSAILTPEATQQ